METDSASPSGYDDSAVRIEGPPFGIDLLHHGLEHDLMMMKLRRRVWCRSLQAITVTCTVPGMAAIVPNTSRNTGSWCVAGTGVAHQA